MEEAAGMRGNVVYDGYAKPDQSMDLELDRETSPRRSDIR